MTTSAATPAAADRQPASPSSWLPRAVALAGYELRLVLRRGEGLLITFVIPAGVLLVFSAFGPAAEPGTVAGVDRLLPGSISLAIIAASLVSLAISTGYERAYGVLKRLGGSPAGSSVVIAAKTASVAVVELVQVALLVAIAVAMLGFQAGAQASAPVVLAALLLGTVAFAGLGLLMAGTLRPEATLALANLLFLLSLVLGGIVLPLERLPDAVAAIASVLPPAALTAALAIGLDTLGGDPTGPLLVLGAWAAVLALLAARHFRWD